MSYKITEDCIACGACEPECPVNAISTGEPIYTIDADKCIECKEHYDAPHCVELCPVECCVPV